MSANAAGKINPNCLTGVLENKLDDLRSHLGVRRTVSKKGLSINLRSLKGSTAFTSLCLSTFVAPTTAFSQSSNGTISQFLTQQAVPSQSSDLLLLSIFGGAMSFAILAAFAMIRERTKLVSENTNLRTSISDLRAETDKSNALIAMAGERYIIWNGNSNEPAVLGELGPNSGAPSENNKFLTFGKWIEPKSLQELEPALKQLLSDGEAFNIPIKTIQDSLLECEGTTSGSFACMRFRELTGERAEHAKLKTSFNLLKQHFTAVETLLQKLPMPVWLRNEEGKLSWANLAYANAVETETPRKAVEENIDLIDPELREKIHNGTEAVGEIRQENCAANACRRSQKG